jgi:hypothetical protein
VGFHDEKWGFENYGMDLLIQNFAKLNQSSRLTRGHDNVNFKPPTCSTFPTAVHVQLTSTWAWSRDWRRT